MTTLLFFIGLSCSVFANIFLLIGISRVYLNEGEEETFKFEAVLFGIAIAAWTALFHLSNQ